ALRPRETYATPWLHYRTGSTARQEFGVNARRLRSADQFVFGQRSLGNGRYRNRVKEPLPASDRFGQPTHINDSAYLKRESIRGVSQTRFSSKSQRAIIRCLKLIPLQQWICDRCGIGPQSPKDGWIELRSDELRPNGRDAHGFRIIHHLLAWPR